MVLFRTCVLAAAFAACTASKADVEDSSSRRLSYELIAGYEPDSLITDVLALDLDQQKMEQQMGLGDPAWGVARAFYEQGAHSAVYAELMLTTKLAKAAKKGALVTGVTTDGNVIAGRLRANAPQGAGHLNVTYDVSSVQSDYVACRANALVLLSEAKHEGCFAPEGNVTIFDDATGTTETANYEYNFRRNTHNGRTLQSISLEAALEILSCNDATHHNHQKKEECPFRGLLTYMNYYGNPLYGDMWVRAAFDRNPTTFVRGNADFSILSKRGRPEVIEKGTVYLLFWMQVVRFMEYSTDFCYQACATCNRKSVEFWDQAVAYYTGSLVGPDADSSNGGVLLYGLAQKRCSNFKTCGENGDELTGTAKVNLDIMLEFKRGQRFLMNAECDKAQEAKEVIKSRIVVPLVQGLLRYAYRMSQESTAGEKASAEGASFAAAVLPLVFYCDEESHDKIYNSMQLTTNNPGLVDFPEVKSALESTYACMRINPEMVGGLFDEVNQRYFAGAEPAGSGGGSSNDKDSGVIAVAVIVPLVVIAAIVAVAFCWKKRHSSHDPTIPVTTPQIDGQNGLS